MKRLIVIFSLIITVGMLSGCASQSRHHQDNLPDPKGFNAHFPDMDGNDDSRVTLDEFAAYFKGESNVNEVFGAIDLDKSSFLDHEDEFAVFFTT